GRERNWPVVVTPVEHIVVAGFLQKIGGDVAFRNPRSQPSARSLTFMPRNLARCVRNQHALFRLRQLSLSLGVCAAMRGDLAASPNSRRYCSQYTLELSTILAQGLAVSAGGQATPLARPYRDRTKTKEIRSAQPVAGRRPLRTFHQELEIHSRKKCSPNSGGLS